MALSTSMDAPETPGWLAPIGWVGYAVVSTLAYFGAMAVLIPSAAAAFVRPADDDEQSLRAATAAELSWMLFAGCPVVALVHVAMGSFLSLQAYYGSTFVDGTGAVVGVGLLRNLASMMTGLTLAGLLPARIIPELRSKQRLRRMRQEQGGQPAPARVPTRGATDQSSPEPVSSPGRLAAARLLAAAIATPLLSLWGFVVGTIVGWQSSESLMGLPTSTFFLMFMRMIWFRDVVGLLIKGALFGFCTAMIACSEGLRTGSSESSEVGPPASPAGCGYGSSGSAILRAACLSMMAILLINMTWFVLIYHAVPIYGPSLMQPPTP